MLRPQSPTSGIWTGIGTGVFSLRRPVTLTNVLAVGSAGCGSPITIAMRGLSPACSVWSASIVGNGLDGWPPGQATAGLPPQLDGTVMMIGVGPWCTSGVYDGGKGGS